VLEINKRIVIGLIINSFLIIFILDNCEEGVLSLLLLGNGGILLSKTEGELMSFYGR
jgi:hypothetical protein